MHTAHETEIIKRKGTRSSPYSVSEKSVLRYLLKDWALFEKLFFQER